jgi:hypothetical protein
MIMEEKSTSAHSICAWINIAQRLLLDNILADSIYNQVRIYFFKKKPTFQQEALFKSVQSLRSASWWKLEADVGARKSGLSEPRVHGPQHFETSVNPLAGYVHHIISRHPGFSDLPRALKVQHQSHSWLDCMKWELTMALYYVT